MTENDTPAKDQWLVYARTEAPEIKDMAIGDVHADTLEEATREAEEKFHLRDGETLHFKHVPSGGHTGPLIVSLSRLKAFRHDAETHEIPLGAFVEVGCGEHGVTLDIGRGTEGEEMCAGLYSGKLRLYVVAQHRDCDGTPLYALGTKPVGPPEDCKVFSREHLLYRAVAQRLYETGYGADGLKVLGQAAEFQTFEEWSEGLWE